MGEAIDRTCEDIFLSSLHPCASGEEDKALEFRTEGYICGIQ
jgi:hypothetical protein